MAETYNIFISWSGERGKAAAKALQGWLRSVLQAARPWMSDTDIDKGSRGLEEVGRALEGMKVGIICLTPENLAEPWILFEAGALSKTLDAKTRVCTYLLGGLRPENVTPPLSVFQWTAAEREDTRKLLHAVNKALEGSPVPESNLNDLFDGMWPQLEKQLGALPKVSGVVAPERSEREMLAELLELSRVEAGNFGWTRDALVTLLRRTNRFSGQAGVAGEVHVARPVSGAAPDYEAIWEEPGSGAIREQFEAGERGLAESEGIRGTAAGSPVVSEDEVLVRLLRPDERKSILEGWVREQRRRWGEGMPEKGKADDEKKQCRRVCANWMHTNAAACHNPALGHLGRG